MANKTQIEALRIIRTSDHYALLNFYILHSMFIRVYVPIRIILLIFCILGSFFIMSFLWANCNMPSAHP